MDTVNLTETKLNLDSIYYQVLTNYTGAVSLFVGTTRDNFEGKKVKWDFFYIKLFSVYIVI